MEATAPAAQAAAPAAPAAAPAAPAAAAAVAAATQPAQSAQPGAEPAPDAAVVALNSFRDANQAAIFDSSHKDHHAALKQYRALAASAFPDAEVKADAQPDPEAMPDPLTTAMTAAMGDVPKDGSGYVIEHPHGTQMTPEIASFESGVRGLMHEMQLPAHLGRFAWNRASELTKNGLPDVETVNRMGDEAEAVLRKDWGDAYESRLAAANSIIKALPAEKAAAVKQLLRVTGLGNDVRTIMQFALLAEHRAGKQKGLA
jgi:hypothetical protein